MTRRREPRITNPDTHPKRYVSLVVAAAFLEVDRKTLNKLLAEGLIPYQQFLSRRKIAVGELVAFLDRERKTRHAS